MTRRASTQFLLVLAAAACLGPGQPLAAANAVKGLGDPGDLKSINVEQAAAGSSIVLRGGDARQQLCVTGVYSTGQLRDLTRAVRYSADPPGIVDVDNTGFIVPLRDGETHVRVTGPAHTAAEFPVRVERFANPLPINFKNQIVPIFT
ncbi:MAG TPA: S-layer protein, partial [Planctomycetaceae bacterium]|nr:S-layer protein [Planctomycetaceae bacterium]